jgi:hypothetical protein
MRNAVQNLVRKKRKNLGNKGNNIPTPTERCKMSEERLIDIHNIYDLELL